MIINNNFRLPLVSIVVIAYNSEDFIVETLESIKSQTYTNIEIIVADDCSLDKTKAIADRWLFDNKNRFVAAKVVVNEKNLGVAANCNNGIKHARGDWVKIIAGDDLLECDAVSCYIEFFTNNPEAKVVLANLTFFGDKSGIGYRNEEFGQLSVNSQLIYLLTHRNPVFGPSGMAHRETILKLGGYDERVPMLEDFPMSLRFLSNGVKIFILDKQLVRYRVRSSGLSGNTNFSEKLWNMLDIVAVPEMRKRKLFLVYWHHKIELFIWMNRDSRLIKFRLTRYVIKCTDLVALKIYLNSIFTMCLRNFEKI